MLTYREKFGVLAGIVVWALLAVGLQLGWWDRMDLTVAEAMPRLHDKGIVPLFVLFSELGSTLAFAVLFTILAGILIWKRKIAEAVALFFSTAGSYGLNTLMKNGFDRLRPPLEHLIEADGFSFPSGNAMVATAFYGMAVYILWRHKGKRAWKWVIAVAILLLLIGFSRIFLNVHYPTDILAGYAAGVSWLFLCGWVLAWYQEKKKLHKSGA